MGSTSVKALEFFSGIGGMHYGLEWSGVEGEVVASFDINPVANECYKHNFGRDPVQIGIDNLTKKAIEKYKANAWFMSPPCQPYTRTGKQLDDEDPRAAGLLHLIDLLGQVEQPPQWIFLENVLNFEKSRSRDRFITQLRTLGYDFQEWLLTPLQMGIPNDRLRYYLTAKLVGSSPGGGYGDELRTHWPYYNQTTMATVAEFLEEGDELTEQYKLPEMFYKKKQAFSQYAVVKASAMRTSCFTKAYGHHGRGAGSYLQTRDVPDGEDILNDPIKAVKLLGIRSFTPKEIARLHGFPIDDRAPKPTHQSLSEPHTFSFPPTLTNLQRWRVLGNSMNVKVVGELMRHVLFASIETQLE
ncbi:tRNA (cytosine-5-)-methyltransferase [Gaertneriomyces sp. JEL0708]|nr:tRNA (cytosine-5-)-methyltransferase [Gaertneriomyces sp. JEL0708]